MTDAYTPGMSTLKLTQDEKDAIVKALTSENPWDETDEAVKTAKNKLRDLHLLRHADTCCYCRTNLHGGGRFMIDREHILPKGRAAYRPFCFEVWNISISCKRCNMELKWEYDDYVVDKVTVAEYQKGENYLLIHPNFDLWEQHISRESQQVNRQVLVKYTVAEGSEKGKFTYDYFDLKGLEVNSFDQGQGIERAADQNASEAVVEARSIASEYGQ